MAVINNRKYNLASWIDKHPGGELLIENSDGKDITELIHIYHPNNDKINKILNNKFSESVNSSDKEVRSMKYFTFDNKYNLLKEKIYYSLINKDRYKYDLIMYVAVILYFLNINCLLNAILLIIIGCFGHQYVHTSSNKASVLTLVGFISNHWRCEHVYSHHPYTNTDADIDLDMFLNINKLPLISGARFIIISNAIVFRPFLQYFWYPYIKSATRYDLIFVIYNLYDLYFNFDLYWYIKRIIPAAWFLLIDSINHYKKPEINFEYNDNWAEQQVNNTQNFIFNKYLYYNYPYMHSLLTFGLDRQVEHHLFPRIDVYDLYKVNKMIRGHYIIKEYVLSLETFNYILYDFA